VLFATTSAARARNFARLAEKLTQGRRLFWFGAYQEKNSDGQLVSRLHSHAILFENWRDAENDEHHLAPHNPVPVQDIAS
jgi:hypothetical protein